MLDPKYTCKRDGFPLIKIKGRWECVGEYLNRCIGKRRVVDVIRRGKTDYYVFENGHELPLLCYCCGEPLIADDWEQARQKILGRRLDSMSINIVIMQDGRQAFQFRLEFSGKGVLRRRGLVEPLDVQVAAQMRHPDDCPYKDGLPLRRRRRSKGAKRKRQRNRQ